MTIIRHYRGGLRPSGGGGGGSTPSWVSTLAEFPTWTQIAKGTGAGFDSGAKLGSVVVSPNQSDPPQSWGSRHGVFDGYTGGCLDPYNQEMLIVAGGGHGDGANNGGFAFALGVETPYWRRIVDGTPDSQIPDSSTLSGLGGLATFNDGRPPAMHATNMVWAGTSASNSKVWYPFMYATTSGGGGHSKQILSFDRGSLGSASTPLAWTGSNIGPWEFHGQTNDSSTVTGFGGAFYDATRNKITQFGNGLGSFGTFWTQFTPATGAITDTFNSNGSLYCDVSAMPVFCPDLDIAIILGGNDGKITVYDPATNTVSQPAQSGTGYYTHPVGAYVGMVYIQENHTLLVADPCSTGSTYYKIQIPLTGSAYNPSGTFVWSSSTWTGGPTSSDYGRPAGSNFVSGKLARHTYANGRAVLVLATNIDGPTFISKIPTAGI